ncbi:helix-turn-helix domain-containing protein [Marinobacter lipolyticus]
MDWDIEFYGKVEEELARMPPKIQARMIRLMELMEKHLLLHAGQANYHSACVYKEGSENTEERPGARERAVEGGQKIMSFKQFKQKALKNPEVRQEYDALEEEFSLIDQLISMRTQAGLTQEDVAKKLGTNKSNISRLERGRSNPSWETLNKYAAACGFRVKLEAVEDDRTSA